MPNDYVAQTWGESAKKYFAINPKSKFFLMALAVKLSTALMRLFPALSTVFIVGDDVTGIGVADDPLLGVTIPMLCLQLLWYAIRITLLHLRANRRLRANN